jgi:uncharacterized protein
LKNLPIFIDTAYVHALISPNDQWHKKAVEWQLKIEAKKNLLLTTEFVLTEIADDLAAIKFRQPAAQVIRILQTNAFVEIIPASSELFAKALKLYEQRQDKSWGLTDCTSFVVMKENKLTDALTTDEHFRQAGFKVLLLD